MECDNRLASLTLPNSRLPASTVPEDEEVTVALYAERLDAPPPFIANPFSSARSLRNADPAALQALAAAAAAQAAQAKGPPALRLGAAAAAASPFLAAQNLVATAAPTVPPPAAGAPSFVSPFAAARLATPAPRLGEPGPGAAAFASPFAAPQTLPPQRSADSAAAAQAGYLSAATTAQLCVPLKQLPVDETRPLDTVASVGLQVSGDSVAALSEAAMFVAACSPPSATSGDRGDLPAASSLSAGDGGGRIGIAAHPVELVPFPAAPAASAPRPAAPAAAAATGDADQGGAKSTATVSGSNPHGEFGRSDSASTAMPPQRRGRGQAAETSDSLRGGSSSRGSSRDSSRSSSLSGSGCAGSCLRGGAPPSPSTSDGRKSPLVQQAAAAPRKVSAPCLRLAPSPAPWEHLPRSGYRCGVLASNRDSA